MWQPTLASLVEMAIMAVGEATTRFGV